MKKVLLLITSITFVFGTPMDEYINNLKVQAKQENPDFVNFDKNRGEKIFLKKMVGKRGKVINCASCHTNDLTKEGENIFTGKKIKPLSPKVNSDRLSDVKKVKKWLRRNFKDVYKAEGSAQEKGDVLLYISNY